MGRPVDFSVSGGFDLSDEKAVKDIFSKMNNSAVILHKSKR
jgi:hypothetical protein